MLAAPILTSAAEIVPQQVNATRQQAGQVVSQLLRQRGGNLQGQILYRDLEFTDLAGAGNTQGQNANAIGTTYANLIADVTVPVNQSFVIFGLVLYDPTPPLCAIKYQLGAAQTLGWINLSPIKGDNRISKGYHAPVYWGPQEIIRVQAVANVAGWAAGSINFDFLGLVAEPTGLNVAPRSDLDALVQSVTGGRG